MRTVRPRHETGLDDRLAGLRDVFDQPAQADLEDEEEERRRRPWVPLLVAVLVALLAIYFAGQTAARLWLEDLDARLLDAGAGTNAQVMTLEREHLEAYRAIANSSGFPEELASYDADAIERHIQPVDANHGIPMIDIVDDQNRVVFAFRAEGALRPVFRDRLDLEIVRKALAGERDSYGERFSQLVTTPDEGPLLATAGPVRSGGRIVGALLLMTPLDELLSQGRNVHGAHLNVYSLDRGDPLATTTPIRPRTFDTELRTALARPEELPRAARFKVGGRTYREQIGALTVRHETAAFVGTALPDRTREVALRVMLVAALGMALLSLLVGFVAYAWARDRYEVVEPAAPRREPPALPAPQPPPSPTATDAPSPGEPGRWEEPR